MSELDELITFIETKYTNCEDQEEALMYSQVAEQLYRIQDLEK